MSYLNKRQTDLPDVQQKVQSYTRKERASAPKDLQAAVKQLDSAKEEYEEALLARSQHIHTWKTFLADAVKNWSEYGTMFAQHEQALQERIATAKEDFKDAKDCLEQSKTLAGKLGIQEISDEEDLWPESEGSAQLSRSQPAFSLSHLLCSNCPKKQKQSRWRSTLPRGLA